MRAREISGPGHQTRGMPMPGEGKGKGEGGGDHAVLCNPSR